MIRPSAFQLNYPKVEKRPPRAWLVLCSSPTHCSSRRLPHSSLGPASDQRRALLLQPKSRANWSYASSQSTPCKVSLPTEIVSQPRTPSRILATHSRLVFAAKVHFL